jgi:hypothetical protein
MGEHSPGPWTWMVVDGLDQLVDAESNYVILANGFMCGHEDAVIIAAAPQLLDHLQRWHVAAHPRGDDSCETCQFLKAIGQPITTPKKGGGR